MDPLSPQEPAPLARKIRPKVMQWCKALRAGSSCLSLSLMERKKSSFCHITMKPCRSLTLNSPIIAGSEVGRAALLDSDGREDKSKVGKESAPIAQGAFSGKQIKIARNGSDSEVRDRKLGRVW